MSFGDRLWGDAPPDDLRMPLHAKALVQARRHLVHDHGLRPASWSSPRALELHLQAHGLTPGAAGAKAVPWGMVGAVHDAAQRREDWHRFLLRHQGLASELSLARDHPVRG